VLVISFRDARDSVFSECMAPEKHGLLCILPCGALSLTLSLLKTAHTRALPSNTAMPLIQT
jgi:hypothetical protein